MTNEDKQQLNDRLVELIRTSKLEIIELEELTQPISPENSLGRISRMDAINNKSVVEAALRTKRKKLDKMETALKNIDNPEFGDCEKCKRPIPAKRLIYMPESTRCVACADR